MCQAEKKPCSLALTDWLSQRLGVNLYQRVIPLGSSALKKALHQRPTMITQKELAILAQSTLRTPHSSLRHPANGLRVRLGLTSEVARLGEKFGRMRPRS